MNNRRYIPEDAAAIAEVFTRSVMEIGRKDYTVEQVEVWASLAASTEQTHARCADGRTVLVAVDDVDRPLAFVDLEVDGHIDYLYCAPEVVGKDIASALYDDLELIARQSGLDRLYTEASEAARRFFLRKGFAVTAERDFEIDGVPFHNYAMEKLL